MPKKRIFITFMPCLRLTTTIVIDRLIFNACLLASKRYVLHQDWINNQWASVYFPNISCFSGKFPGIDINTWKSSETIVLTHFTVTAIWCYIYICRMIFWTWKTQRDIHIELSTNFSIICKKRIFITFVQRSRRTWTRGRICFILSAIMSSMGFGGGITWFDPTVVQPTVNWKSPFFGHSKMQSFCVQAADHKTNNTGAN